MQVEPLVRGSVFCWGLGAEFDGEACVEVLHDVYAEGFCVVSFASLWHAVPLESGGAVAVSEGDIFG